MATLYVDNIRIDNLPDDLHERLRRVAKLHDTTVGELARVAIEREVYALEQLAEIGVSVNGSRSASSYVIEERIRRDAGTAIR